jgi:hypothetical protein
MKNGYLYTCRFENGHIKVGMSRHQPGSRIAAHKSTANIMRTRMVESHTFECQGGCALAEKALIGRCVMAGGEQFAREWFSGIDYALVSAWAAEEAAVQRAGPAPRGKDDADAVRSALDAMFKDKYTMDKRAWRDAAHLAAGMAAIIEEAHGAIGEVPVAARRDDCLGGISEVSLLLAIYLCDGGSNIDRSALALDCFEAAKSELALACLVDDLRGYAAQANTEMRSAS